MSPDGGGRKKGLGRHRAPKARRAGLLAGILLAASTLFAGCGVSPTASALQSRLLSVSDLPTGWSPASTSSSSVVLGSTPCLSGLSTEHSGWTNAVAGFVEGTAIPAIGEVLATGPKAQQRWQALGRAFAGCRAATLDLAGKKVTSTVRALPFPHVAHVTSAYAWQFTVSGLKIGFDLVLFRVGKDVGYLSYADLGAPLTPTVRTYVRAAIAKAQGKPVRIPDTISVASAPVLIAHTRMGPVAYRSVGSGTPLILIMGYAGTMDIWDRQFVDALAQSHRVVVFDNAGIGRTKALAPPLTIDAMANQTGALLTTLGIRRADVLGWSMGGMIAQALAVLHPAQVRRLVLCATYAGTGGIARPTREAIDALTSSDPQQALADLFPPGQASAQNTYTTAASGYPPAPAAPRSTVSAQARAVDAWWAGTDPAGRRTASITAPTLVADGTEDRLDPVVNSISLAKRIPGAQLVLYPEAGHAFLFQDQSTFVARVEAFLR